MTPALEPYPAYRDSGLPWLGDVPKHWEVRRLKSCVKDVIDMTREREPGDNYVALEHVESWTGKTSDVDLDTSFESQVKRFRPNDVLFGKLRPYLAKTTRPDREGVCVGEFLVLRSCSGNPLPSYLEASLRSRPVIDAIDASTFGAKMPRADWRFIGNMGFPLPPLSEQAAIARYLDHVGERVDFYIGAKERLIALLNEKKQAIVNRAVTRGLDPSAPMKPTDIDWMPEAPAHWEIVKLKRLARMRSGEGITAETIREIGPYRVFGGNGIRGHTDRFTHDGVFALIGRQGALCGNVHLASGQFWASEHAIVASLKAPNNIRWFVDLLRIMNLNQYSEAAAQPGLAVDHIVNLYIPAPPKDEQEAIARYLSDESNDLDTAIDRARRQIGLLREYRERLISDVVTGKLDVREARAGNGGSS